MSISEDGRPNRRSTGNAGGRWSTAIELRILSVIPTRNPTLTLLETHTEEITIRSRIKSMKTAL